MSPKRTLLAFVLAPLVTPIVIVGAWFETDLLRPDDILGFFSLISIFAYAAAIVFGIPLVVVTRRTRSSKLGFAATAAVGFAATGAVAGLLVATALQSVFRGWTGDFQFPALCALAGGLSGFAFWIISYWNLPAQEPNHKR